MSRLRNRMTKATFWTDGELLRWSRDKRWFYKSLWAMAEDSCCIEDDPFEWKLTAWASPLDSDITVELIQQWRDELIECGKIVRYTDGSKSYLYLRLMADHERPRNPQPNDLPLPPWVVCTVTGRGKSRRVEYVHGDCGVSVQSDCGNRNASVQNDSGNRSGSLGLSCPVQSSPEVEIGRAAALPQCLSETTEGVSWNAPDGTDHDSPARAFWHTAQTSRGANPISTKDAATFASVVAESCPTGCTHSEDEIDKCLQVLMKAATKTSGKPSPLFRRICEEDR